MRTIGFHGGCTISELGPVSDMVLFFDCLKGNTEYERSDQDWSLLTDRLYRRYLRLEELDKASALMEQAQQIFARRPSASAVEWDPKMVGNPEKSWLDPRQPTLADVFIKYFENFANVRSSAEHFLKGFNLYKPVRVVISDLPGFCRDADKPPAEYDALEGKPFWLR